MNWKRIIVWSLAIFAASNFIAFASGVSMKWWEIYGATIDVAVENARFVRRIGYALVGALLYWRFALGVARHRFTHVLAVSVALQVIDVLVTVIVYRAPYELAPWALMRNLVAAFAGYALAQWQTQRAVATT